MQSSLYLLCLPLTSLIYLFVLHHVDADRVHRQPVATGAGRLDNTVATARRDPHPPRMRCQAERAGHPGPQAPALRRLAAVHRGRPVVAGARCRHRRHRRVRLLGPASRRRARLPGPGEAATEVWRQGGPPARHGGALPQVRLLTLTRWITGSRWLILTNHIVYVVSILHSRNHPL